MNKGLVAKLGIKPGNTVCLVRPNKQTLEQIRAEGKELKLIINKIEQDCDVILYRIDLTEDIGWKMTELQSLVKPDGRIWLITPKKEIARKRGWEMSWNDIQQEILETHLVDNKIASINAEEYGTQFVLRKEHRK